MCDCVTQNREIKMMFNALARHANKKKATKIEVKQKREKKKIENENRDQKFHGLSFASSVIRILFISIVANIATFYL